MMKKLDNRVAIVTGGTGSLGNGVLSVFLREGAKVLCTYVEKSQLEYSNDLKEEYGDKLIFSKADVTKSKDMKKVVERAAKKFGRVDKEEKIRVSIVKGIEKKNPLNYRVCISGNYEFHDFDKSKRYIQMARKNTMTPNDTKNLDAIHAYCAKYEGITLAPVVFDPVTSKPIDYMEKSITVRNVNIIDAWSISTDDPDMMAISPSDDPIVPTGIENPPVDSIFSYFKKSDIK